jgi:hypothetical protein
MHLSRIVSGGQTGVDRGALDAALACGFPCGGWCPHGRLAEDGSIPEHYPLSELAGAGYEQRTRQNVIDSDGTAILTSGALEGGTRGTLERCIRYGKPHLLIDASTRTPDCSAREIAAFVERERISTLNVAGPRASKWPGARDYAQEVVSRLLQMQMQVQMKRRGV